VLLTSESDYFILNYVSDRVSRPYSAVGKVLYNPLDKKGRRDDRSVARIRYAFNNK
jgi:hypothetical protein